MTRLNLLYKRLNDRAFISLPIILLLLFVLSLFYAFYQTLADERQWRYQEQMALNDRQIWQAFVMDVVNEATASMAQISPCSGFCALTELNSTDWLREYVFNHQNKENKLYWFLSQNSNKTPYYRLCAEHQSLNERRCWWYQEKSGVLIQLGTMPF